MLRREIRRVSLFQKRVQFFVGYRSAGSQATLTGRLPPRPVAPGRCACDVKTGLRIYRKRRLKGSIRSRPGGSRLCRFKGCRGSHDGFPCRRPEGQQRASQPDSSSIIDTENRSTGGMVLLTLRERDVVRLTAEAMRNQEISLKLHLSAAYAGAGQSTKLRRTIV